MRILQRFIVLLFVMSMGASLKAQAGPLQVARELFANMDSSLATDSLNELAWEQLNLGSYAISISYAKLALQAAHDNAYTQGLGDANSRLGASWQKQDRFDSAAHYHTQSLRYRQELGDSMVVANSCLNLGLAHAHLGNLPTSKQYLSRAENIYGNNPMMAILNQAWGEHYDLAEKPDSALLKYGQSLDSLRKMDAGTGQLGATIGSLLYDMSLIFSKINDFNKAFEYLREAERLAKGTALSGRIFLQKANLYLQAGNSDSAKYYYQSFQSLGYSIQDTSSLALVNNNLGMLAVRDGEYAEAETLLAQSIVLWKATGANVRLIDPLRNMGLALTGQKKFNAALDRFREAITISDSLGLAHKKVPVYSDMALAFNAMGRTDSAYLYKNKEAEAKEKLTKASLEATRLLRLMEQKEFDQERELAAYKERQLISYGLIALGALLSIILALAIRNHLQHRMLLQKKLEIRETEQEQIVSLANAHKEGIRDERARLSQELHDKLGTVLTLSKMRIEHLQSALEGVEEDFVESIAQTRDLLDKAYDDLRAISHNLNDNSLKKYGLIWSLNQLKAEVEGISTLTLTLDTPGFDERLSFGQESQVYLIVSELVQNILKHAEAKTALVQLLQTDEGLSLLIEDDGKGFDPSLMQEGIGLENVQSRVQKLGGSLDIDSGPGKGTNVLIDIPIDTIT